MLFCCCSNAAEVETTAEFADSVHPVADLSDDAPCLLKCIHPVTDYSHDATSLLKCKVKRDGGEWGALLDGWDDCIQIIEVKDGRIQEYNNSVGDEKKLTPGDFIVQIDGNAVTRDTLAALKPMAEADFTIAQPTKLRARIEQGVRKDGMGWGMKLNYHKNRSRCLRVGTINAGGIAEFNKTAEVPVKERDFIVEVNSCRDDPEKMLEMLKSSDELDLSLIRLP